MDKSAATIDVKVSVKKAPGEKRFIATREIGIDAGHRVTYHGSKCRNVHGHRYRIEATWSGPLVEQGAEQGMVTDFGFMKQAMMDEIDAPCDHGLILWSQDPLVKRWAVAGELLHFDAGLYLSALDVESMDHVSYTQASWEGGKLYVVPFVPTAENLARHWYERLTENTQHTNPSARVEFVKVWETPNCSTIYPFQDHTT